jgi:hypothetical protein
MRTLKNISLLFIILFLSIGCDKTEQTNYFFDALRGSNSNSGRSINTAFKSLDHLKTIPLKPGDTVFLSSAKAFEQPLELLERSGSKAHPIVITNYPTDANALAAIHTQSYLNAVLIENSSFIEINNLDISALTDLKSDTEVGKMRCGVLVHTTKAEKFQHIYLSNLKIHDVFFNNKGFTRPKAEVKTANGTQAYGWGIRFINNTEGATIENIKVENSEISNVSHTGIKLTSRLKGTSYGITDFQINGNKVFETGGPGIQMSGVFNGHVLNNDVDKSGSNNDTRKWGRGSGLWTWGSSNILIEHNRFTNANGPGDSAGAHIDFNCKNVVLQYNFSANNAGGFCEILGNNYNCAYRYNISVNDGHRIKGENGAFQEGKIFWLSGYNGNKPQSGPFNSYFYNNTIYVGKNIIPKIAIHKKAKGVLIANNIFHFERPAEVVKGDQYRPEKESDWQVDNVVFRNNLFLKTNTWPQIQQFQDENPFFGNAGFQNEVKLNLTDYKPSSLEQIKQIIDNGIQVQAIPGDTIGLVYGLNLKYDILGNPIRSFPDLGAIEID